MTKEIILETGVEKTIKLSTKDDTLIDAGRFKFDCYKDGNDLILGVYTDDSDFYVSYYILKNYTTLKYDVKINTTLDNGEYFSGSLREYLDNYNAVLVGDMGWTKSKTVKGSKLSEVILSGSGKDKLYGNDGNDIFMAGSGNDTIYGGKDKNTFVFSSSYNEKTDAYDDNFGTDTVHLKDAETNLIAFHRNESISMDGELIPITQNDLSFKRVGNDLHIKVSDDSELKSANGTIVLKDYMNKIDETNVHLLLNDNNKHQDLYEYIVREFGENTDIIEVIKQSNIGEGGERDLTGIVTSLKDLITTPENHMNLFVLGDDDATKGLTIKDSKADEIIYGGDGANKITITGGSDKIFLGEGNNTIKVANGSSPLAIIAGDGKNTITLGNDIFIQEYNYDGETYSEDTNIQLGDGNNTIKAGNNVYIESIDVGDGKNTIKIGNKSDVYVETGNGNTTVSIGKNTEYFGIDSYDGNDKITIGNDAEYVEIFAGNGKNTITIGKDSGFYNPNAYDNPKPDEDVPPYGITHGITIETGKDKDTIKIGDEAEGVDINAGDGNNSISIGKEAEHVKIFTGKDNDTITIGKEVEDLFISSGDGVDKITVGKTNSSVEINAGAGDDIVKTSALFNNLRYEGEFGNDTITIDKKSFNRLHFDDGVELKYTVKKNDLVITAIRREEHDLSQEIVMGSVTIKDYAKTDFATSNLEIEVGGDTKDIPAFQIGQYSDKRQTIKGTRFNDIITGGSNKDTITTGGGVDVVYADDGNDTIKVSNGISRITAGEYFYEETSSRIYGEGDKDTITGGKYTYNYLDGGDGIDTIIGGSNATNVIYGGDGFDKITAGSGDKKADAINTIYGDDGDDTIKIGSYSANRIEGGAGNDVITVSGKYNTNEFICYDNHGTDTITLSKYDKLNILKFREGSTFTYEKSENGKDLIIRTASPNGNGGIILKNYLSGGYKNVYMQVGDNETQELSDLINVVDYSKKYPNQISEVDSVQNIVIGNSKKETIWGSENRDVIYTGTSKNVQGGGGDDIIFAGSGNNEIYGGVGMDMFLADKGDKFDITKGYLSIKNYSGSLSTDDFINYGASESNYRDGLNDSLFITGQGSSDELVVLFDIARKGYDLGSEPQHDPTTGRIDQGSDFAIRNTLFITKNPAKIETGRIEILNYFSDTAANVDDDGTSGILFGDIYNYDDGAILNKSAINEIVQNVQSWLQNTEYYTSNDALYNGSKEDVQALLNCYQVENLWNIPGQS